MKCMTEFDVKDPNIAVKSNKEGAPAVIESLIGQNNTLKEKIYQLENDLKKNDTQY